MGTDRDDLITGSSPSMHGREHAEGVKGSSYTSEKWLRTVLGSTSDVIMVLGADATVHFTSPAVELVLGYLPEDLVGTIGFG